jgi:DNA-binding GntR family transcriptional regulator
MKLNLVMPNSLKEQAYTILKNAIITGILKDNEMITEQYVHEKFNVSRTPFREAIQTLEAEGWVYSIPYKGKYVKPITHEDVKEIFELRLIIEPNLAKQIQSLPDCNECITKLKRNLSKMKADSVEQSDIDFMSLDYDFHRTLYEHTNNSRIKDISDRLSDTMLRLGIKYGNTTRREEVMQEHGEIIVALGEGDVDQVVTKHLEKALTSFIEQDGI